MTWENRLSFEVSSADPDSASPVWVNLTTRIRDLIQPATTQIGRQNDLNQAEPGRLDLLLDNSDNALTYGNTASPYTWWGPGRKCRLRELVNGVTTTRFTGYLQVPTETLITAGIEQRVSITAVDRLGQLASDEPFVSTLGAQIMSTSADTLKLYYPLNDATQPYRPAVGTGDIAVAPYMNINPSPIPPVMVTPRVVAGPAGDDATFPNFTPLYFDPPTPVAGCGAMPYGTARVAVHVSSGETIAVSAWMRPMQQIPALVGSAQDAFFLALLNDVGYPASLGSHGIYFLDRPSSTGTASADQGGASFVQLVAPGPFPREVWRLITTRLTLPSGAFTLWIGSDVVVSGVMASAPASTDFSFLHFGSQYFGSLAHIQVHVGVNAFPYSAHLAQAQAGLVGFERQTTGDRIRTIAAYAGIPAAELTQIDKGQSVMQPAQLAGKDPLTAMRDAERTEQGLLYADGDGNLVFKDRSSLYNI